MQKPLIRHTLGKKKRNKVYIMEKSMNKNFCFVVEQYKIE